MTTSITFEKRGDRIIFEIPIRDVLAMLRDGFYTLTIALLRGKASVWQFRYYRGAVLPCIAEETGAIYAGMPNRAKAEILAKVHEHLLEYCAPQTSERNMFDRRRKVRLYLRTRDMDTKQMTDFIETIRLCFPEYRIPDPEDRTNADAFYDQMIARFPNP